MMRPKFKSIQSKTVLRNQSKYDTRNQSKSIIRTGDRNHYKDEGVDVICLQCGKVIHCPADGVGDSETEIWMQGKIKMC